MDSFLDYVLLFLTQIGGGPGPRENNLVRFGLAAVLWGVLLVVVWQRRQAEGLPDRERLLVWGFALGFAREAFMFSHVSLHMLEIPLPHAVSLLIEPLEHTLSLSAVIVVAAAFMRYILRNHTMVRIYLQSGLVAAGLLSIGTLWWWSAIATSSPDSRFNQTWAGFVFHAVASVALLVAMIFLARRQGWLRNVVLLALTFFFLGEFLQLINFSTGFAYRPIICPICNTAHIIAIPLFGYVYLREQAIEKGEAERALQNYRDHLEDVVKERTDELQTANQQLKQEIAERKQTAAALAHLSRQHELILNSAGEGILGMDPQGLHTFVNPAAARLLGYNAGELLGQAGHATWHHSRPDGRPYPQEDCPIHSGHQLGRMHEARDDVFWHKDGSPFPVRFASAPMYENGNLTGVVVVFQDIAERKRAEDQLTRRAQEMAAQNLIAATISQSLDLDTILSRALDTVMGVLEMDAGCVYLLEPTGETLSLRKCLGMSEPDPTENHEHRLRVGECLSGLAVTEQQPIVVDVADFPPDCLFPFDQYEGLQTLVSTPLQAKGRAVGALTLGATRPEAISATDQDLVTSIGQQIGMAVDNAGLYQETEHWAEALARLHEVSLVLSSTLDIDETCVEIARQAALLIDCPMTLLYQLKPDQHRAMMVSGHGLNGAQTSSLQLERGAGSLLEDILTTRQSLQIGEAQTDPRTPVQWRDQFHVQSLLCVPLWSTEEPVAFLFLLDPRHKRQWQSNEVRLVESFADRAAVALENAQLQKQLEWAAALEERQRIAADMHDGLAQTLSYLALTTGHASELLENGQTEPVLARHADLQDAIARASREVRRSIASLREPPEPRRSLQECLEQVVRDFAAFQGGIVQLLAMPPEPLYVRPVEADQVLRVVQEALVNAHHHAHAAEISLGLEIRGEEISVTVKDQGRGFDPKDPMQGDSEHFGLSIMRARAAQIGGRLTVNSAPGQGTEVILSWTTGHSATANGGQANPDERNHWPRPCLQEKIWGREL